MIHLDTTTRHGQGNGWTPPLWWGTWRTAPYLHDGGRATLEDLLDAGRHGQFRR